MENNHSCKLPTKIPQGQALFRIAGSAPPAPRHVSGRATAGKLAGPVASRPAPQLLNADSCGTESGAHTRRPARPECSSAKSPCFSCRHQAGATHNNSRSDARSALKTNSECRLHAPDMSVSDRFPVANFVYPNHASDRNCCLQHLLRIHGRPAGWIHGPASRPQMLTA